MKKQILTLVFAIFSIALQIISFNGNVVQGKFLDNWYYRYNQTTGELDDSIRLTNCSFKLKVIN